MKCKNCPIRETHLCPMVSDAQERFTANPFNSRTKDTSCVLTRAEIKRRASRLEGYRLNWDVLENVSFDEAARAEIIETAKHMVGLDNVKPYHRHGKAFYKPYRNYFAAGMNGEPVLDKLPESFIRKEQTARRTYYQLTLKGLLWLQYALNITFKE